MAEQQPIPRPYIRVDSVVTPPSSRPPIEELMDLAEDRTRHGLDRRVEQEKIDLVRAAIAEMQDYVQEPDPRYPNRKMDSQYWGNPAVQRIQIEDGYIDPYLKDKTPMFRIHLMTSTIRFRDQHGIIVNIDFRTKDNGEYMLTTNHFQKNAPPRPKNDPSVITQAGNLNTLSSKTYEIIRPIINGYRELAARDEVVDGGERIIPGHNFEFQPLP